MSETEAKWNTFTATQLVTTHSLGFDWNAQIQMAPGFKVFVHDTYLLGVANLKLGLILKDRSIPFMLRSVIETN
jgi:hypothetical protein